MTAFPNFKQAVKSGNVVAFYIPQPLVVIITSIICEIILSADKEQIYNLLRQPLYKYATLQLVAPHQVEIKLYEYIAVNYSFSSDKFYNHLSWQCKEQ